VEISLDMAAGLVGDGVEFVMVAARTERTGNPLVAETLLTLGESE
jgi:hypothetical protein